MRLYDVVGAVFLPPENEPVLTPNNIRCVLVSTVMLSNDDEEFTRKRGEQKLRELCPEAKLPGAILRCMVRPSELSYIRAFLDIIEENLSSEISTDDDSILDAQIFELPEISDAKRTEGGGN